MPKPMTVHQFLEEFPDDDACLAHLFLVRYGKEPVCPKCGQINTFHKLSKMPAYTCNCGHHVHPMVDTPFHRSRTPLQKWFFAMFLFTTTRNGVAATSCIAFPPPAPKVTVYLMSQLSISR